MNLGPNPGPAGITYNIVLGMILALPWLILAVMVVGASFYWINKDNRNIRHPKKGDEMKNEKGIVLLLSLLIMTLLGILAMVFLTIALRESQTATNYKNHTTAFYAAEAGLESGVADLKELLAVNLTPNQGDLDGVAPRAMTSPLYTFTAFTVERISDFQIDSSITQGMYAGLFANATEYLIKAQATGPRGSRSRQSQVVRHLEIPLFQFGVFYGKGVDLEIAPGPPMMFNGRVHANSDMYLKNDSMTFDAEMTAVGNIYRYLKSDPTDRGSNPNIMGADGSYHALNFDHDTDVNFGGPWTPSDWVAEAWNVFGGRVQDSAMGVVEIVPPVPPGFYDPANPDTSAHQLIEEGNAGDTQEMKDAKFYYQAGLRFENNTAYDQSGFPVDLSGCATPVVKVKAFHDAREDQMMIATELDVQALQDCGKMPANGIIYLRRNDGASKKGSIRIVNGTTLPAGGLTIASGNPVYVKGDFNKAGNVPAAILGDAITVLSNNWDDVMATDATSARPAANTEIHAAFALGPNTESAVGQGNGQLENVIRFLEDWSGKDFTYKGSIVAMWHSQSATGDWRCCGDAGNNYYNPPNRIWSYDALFNTITPPGTPRGIYVGKGRWSEGG